MFPDLDAVYVNKPVRPNAPHTHNVSHHDGFGIASQGILQEACQLRVPIWNMRAFTINLGRGEGGEEGEEDKEGGVVKEGRGREEKVRRITNSNKLEARRTVHVHKGLM